MQEAALVLNVFLAEATLINSLNSHIHIVSGVAKPSRDSMDGTLSRSLSPTMQLPSQRIEMACTEGAPTHIIIVRHEQAE